MKLAFCLFNYFPYGGLQRDCVRIAKACVNKGHSVEIFTQSWEGDVPPSEIAVHILPVSGWQNHTRADQFAKAFAHTIKNNPFDLVVGFNKIPHLDLYYGADICYKERARLHRSWWYRLMPRYRRWVKLEGAVFGRHSATQILLISPFQQGEYTRSYHTPAERFHFLPPGIDLNRKAPENAAEIRQKTRQENKIDAQENLVLFVGSGFRMKGLDRAILAIASLPEALRANTRLFVLGQDNDKKFRELAAQLQISDRIVFLGGRKDVPQFLLAADLFLHPARHENTGTVLLEAPIAGLPVLTTDVCGYAHYVREAEAGIVLPSPFEQSQLNQTLLHMLSSSRKRWQQNGLALGENPEIYAMPDRALAIIESMGADRVSVSSRAVFSAGPSDFLEPHLHSYFTHSTNFFADMMSLKGECVRAQDGRYTQRIILGERSYFIKQHFGIGWKEIIKNLSQLRLPIFGAKNEWQAIARLREQGVLTPTVVAYGSQGRNPASRQSFVLMEEIHGVTQLDHHCGEWVRQPPTFAHKYWLIQELARIVRIMHRSGVNHRDCYLCHFLLGKNGKLFLIDFHRAHIRDSIPSRWIIKDLAGLYFSSKDFGLTARDRLRFIKAYTERPLRSVLNKEKHFWDKVVIRGEKLYQQHK